jgi:hypothetical protein
MQHDSDRFDSRWDFLVEILKKRDELRLPLAIECSAPDLAQASVESRKQVQRPAATAFVFHRRGLVRFGRPGGCRATPQLLAGRLINAQDHFAGGQRPDA